jgi:hypothetical protein
VADTKPGTAGAATVHLSAVAPYDPLPGDGHEGDSLVPRATDGNPSTYWETEQYTTAQFGNLKHGVGLVLDAGKSMRLARLTVQTRTPGFTALVKTGDSPTGPFTQQVSSQQTTGRLTNFTLHVPSVHRYYLIWITTLTRLSTGGGSRPFAAEIAEVNGS